MIADRSGASVIIGAENGKLIFEKSNHNRGFGSGRQILDSTFKSNSILQICDGIRILKACQQGEPYATKYSNIYDLKTGDIYIYRFSDWDYNIKLNLTAELNKGEHYYDIPQIRNQLKAG